MVYGSNRWERSKEATICIIAWKRNISSNYGNQLKTSKITCNLQRAEQLSFTHTHKNSNYRQIHQNVSQKYLNLQKTVTHILLTHHHGCLICCGIAKLYVFNNWAIYVWHNLNLDFCAFWRYNGPFLGSVNSSGERHFFFWRWINCWRSVGWQFNQFLRLKKFR